MIDKRIFYCWFGNGKMSQLNTQCIESWEKFCPDYEIEQINETNFDYTVSDYAIEGYEKGNWSAVSNTARLEILKKESGFYLDTDVLLLKSLDEVREYDKGFITEFDSGQPDSGVLGRGSTYPELYEVARQELTKGTVLHKNFIRNMYRMYDVHGERIKTYDDGFTILGEEYFPTVRFGLCTNRTIAIHYFENTWVRNPINITDKFCPFQKVQVFVNGKEIYKDTDATIKVEMRNLLKKWKGPEVLGRLNYFFNPKVMKIQTRDCVAERINWDSNRDNELKLCITSSGTIVWYLK